MAGSFQMSLLLTICFVSDLYSDDDSSKEEEKAEAEDDDDNYEDADDDVEEDNGAIGKQLMQNGLQSPDSGIHGDKSANELSLSA